ncbi:hypothetical protein CYG48_10455 [Neorhizobium sp. SOG26]|jgi:hypothetical protein|uniref:hypothetical protein n=1 Tax=Neorhizobium sp. SOG26 TaxID=2060726 RepID=UPI000E56F969|nr:hypothetical protein [Neorhizobium sp. SOG26]AXV16076.1 hypothetical protein CYG48_10455 [Neorhizobium sp. SOG26]
MANQATSDGKSKGGALDIKNEHVAPIGSDGELKASSKPSVEKASGAASLGDAVQPVEKFDPPAQDADRRIFQNGDTDRDR